ncbi:hypothetical protein ACFL60_04285 [Candidatus Omnitrophota bacterium]
MILPHPESNLSLNLMILGAEIIKQFKMQENFVLIETVLNEFLQKDLKRTPDMFINALTFLYAMGLIEKKAYRIKMNQRNKYIQKELFKNA